MKYNFDNIPNRKGSNSLKWDKYNINDLIPMWVADMDFYAAPFIREALQKRLEHGVFGYSLVPKSYYDSICSWFKKKHNWDIEESWILYTTGVVPAISATIKAFTDKGDKVIIQNPVYNCFFSSIKNCGCEILESPLKYIDKEIDGYKLMTNEMDFEDLDKKCQDPKAKILLLCNPHNPAGRVWTKEELKKVGEICRKHNILVISDEIHCELIMPNHKFTSFASVSQDNQDICITLNSPSKSFNIAGLQIANIITNHQEWQDKINKVLNVFEICDVNPFGIVALEAAYSADGEIWLKQLNEYIHENYISLLEAFKELSEFKVNYLEGTYLAWINCECLNKSSKDICIDLFANENIKLNDGAMYGRDGFIRINMATSKQLFDEGVKRIVTGLKRMKKS